MELNIDNIEQSKNDIKRNLRLPEKMGILLAEDIGIMVGDGHVSTNKRERRAMDYVVACYGNAITDREYLKDYISNLKKKLFNLNFRFSDQKKNTCELRIYSKGLVEFYTKVIGLPDGKKEQIKIPSIIKEGNKAVKCAFLRGLGDTDFSLTFKKRDKDYLNYPTIKINSSSKNLILDLREILYSLGVEHSISLMHEYIHPKTKNR